MDKSVIAGWLAVAAAALWLASSILWFRALRVKLDLGEGPADPDDASLRMSGGEGEEPAFTINGMSVPTFRKLADYQRTTYFWNAWASGLSGLAALCAAASAALLL